MSIIINNWLNSKLGIIVKDIPNDFASATKDGYILALLLQSYGLITKEQLELIQKSTDTKICHNNFSHIVHWLSNIKVMITDEEIENIVNEVEAISLNVFYKLYLVLFNKGKVDFICQQQLRQRLRSSTNKFQVTSVVEGTPHKEFSPNTLSRLLWDGHDIIHWHQDRLKMILETREKALEDYRFLMRNQPSICSDQKIFGLKIREKDDQHHFEVKSVTSLNQTFAQLYEEQRRVKCLKVEPPDPKKANRLLKNLKNKMKNDALNKEVKKQLHKEVLSDFWQSLSENERQEHEKIITEKIAKQSLYEKQMIKKIEEVKLQKAVIIENKNIWMNEVDKKREEEFMEQLLAKDKEFNDKEFNYYLEKERLLERHRKSYAERNAMKAMKHYGICWDAVGDIVDVAIFTSEYKKYYGVEPSDVTKKTWRQCFVSELPLEDFIPTIEDILVEPEEEEVDDIRSQEAHKQDTLDIRDFENYCDFEYPWDIDKLNLDEADLNEWMRATNVLSYIVYRLLDLKYPPPPSNPRPDLPDLEAAVCVLEIKDTSCLSVLKKLLEHRKIKVFEITDAVNYCCDLYVNEIASLSSIGDSDSNIELKSEDLKFRKQRSSKSKKSLTLQELISGEIIPSKSKVDVKTQTPKMFPDEEPTLSIAADLGKIATEELENGMMLSDFLLVSMFVEYLKVQENMKGWVLINFPYTYDQAVLLEQALTGIPVPEVVYKITSTDVSFSDIFNKKNISDESRPTAKLLQRLERKESQAYYKTVLTAFIKMRYEDEEERNIDLMAKIDKEQKNYTQLERFYADMGCLYSLYYSTFNFAVVKQLAKLIIGDFAVPPKNSVELFGDTINFITAEQILAGMENELRTTNVRTHVQTKATDEKKSARRTTRVKKSEMMIDKSSIRIEESTVEKLDGKKKKKQESVYITKEDKTTQAPEEQIVEVEEEEQPEPPQPGEFDWQYINIDLPENIAQNLATFWETAELTYIEDFKMIFFIRRVLVNTIVPYVKFIKDHVDSHIYKDDDRDIFVTQFQQMYNGFDNDVRLDEEFKAELHYRVEELRTQLLKTCEKKMMKAEAERMAIIKEMCAPRQMIEYANNTINAYQMELDRYFDTMFLINEYYSAMITKTSGEQSIQKELLSKFDLEDENIQNEVNKLFKSPEESSTNVNPFASKIEPIANHCKSFINKINKLSNEQIERKQELFKPVLLASKTKKDGKSPLKQPELSKTVLENQDTLVQEWKTALKGEVIRTKIRIKLLEMDCLSNLAEMIEFFKNAYHGILAKIEEKFAKETECILNICQMFHHAIEAEVPIREELILKDDRLFADMTTILIPESKKELKTFTVKTDNNFVFTIKQLEYIIKILFDLAPEGCTPERTFIYLLQDLISTEDMALVPKTWTNLSGPNVEVLSGILFGHEAFIEWKEFIIRNLNMPYPTIDELLKLIKNYTDIDTEKTELISQEQFYYIPLWFEKINDSYEEDVDVDDQSDLIKNLLFNLFRVNDVDFNYTAMLLSFCKGQTVSEGFAKALSISVQRPVCFDAEHGNTFIEKTLEQRRLQEKEVEKLRIEHEKLTEDVKVIMEGVLDQVMLNYEINILDVPSELNSMTNDRLLKKMFPSKDKKPVKSTENLETLDKYSSKDSSQDKDTSKDSSQEFQEQFNSKSELPKDSEEFVNEEQSSEETGCTSPCSEASNDTTMYFLPMELVERVLNATLLWYGKVENIEDRSAVEDFCEFFYTLRNEQFDMQVLAHELLNNPDFINFISRTPKFRIIDPPSVVSDLIENQKNCE